MTSARCFRDGRDMFIWNFAPAWLTEIEANDGQLTKSGRPLLLGAEGSEKSDTATMTVVIIGSGFGFPNGTGAAARVRAYALGLPAAGATVEVLCVKPTEPEQGPALNPDDRGEFDGVPFRYTCGTSRSAGLRSRNAALFFKGIWNAASHIRRTARNRTTVMLAFSGDDSLSLLLFKLISLWCHVPLVGERSEFPMVTHPDGFPKQVKGWINDKFLYRLMDGMIVISSMLEKHFRALLGMKVPIIRVPILVNSQQFSNISETAWVSQPTVVSYCGNLDQPGEVETLVEAFRIATSVHRDWRLQIIGGSQTHDRSKAINGIVTSAGLGSRVTLTGPMSHERIPSMLSDSAILALPRARGAFSSAGFPTKLGEYLATGRPVVVTATGDIPQYLKDGESAYLVEPNDTDAFAARLSYVMGHPREASIVGLKGKKVAEEHFDSHRECARILSWFGREIVKGAGESKHDRR